MQIIVGCRRSAHWHVYHTDVAARVYVNRKCTYTCIRLLTCYHQLIMTPEFTFVHKFSGIFTTFSCGRFVRRSISCCTDANTISELNETQTRHFQEETKRFRVAPDGFLSELSSKNVGTGRRRSCTSLVESNHRLRRENVFLGFVFRYLNKMYFHLRNMLPFCRLPTSTEIGANSRVSVADRLQPKQQQRSGYDKLFSSWTVIRPLLWLLMITTHEERGWRSWVIHSISPAGPWCEKCRCFLFLWSIYVLTVPKIISRPQFSFHFASVSVNPAPVRWWGRGWVVPVYYGAQRVVPQVPVQRSRLHL